MYSYDYKDYPLDGPMKKECGSIRPGESGCEMREAQGWGDMQHQSTYKSKGIVEILFSCFKRKR